MLDFLIDEEALNGLEENLQKLYTKKDDGQYQLEVGGLPEYDGLKQKNAELFNETKKERELRRGLEEKVAQFEKEKHQEHKKSGDIEALEKSYLDKIAKMESENKQKADLLHKQIYDLTVGQTATNIASELAVQGSGAVLLPHIQNRLTLDENQKVRVLDLQGNISALTLDDLKQEFRANAAFKPLIAGSYGQGSGAAGSNRTPATLKRGDMDAKQMAEFVKQNGIEAYLKLPK